MNNLYKVHDNIHEKYIIAVSIAEAVKKFEAYFLSSAVKSVELIDEEVLL